MANGISDLIGQGGGGLRAALAAQRDARRGRLDEQVQAAGAGLTGIERGLAQFGAGLGGGIAGEVFKGPDSAEVEQARANQNILEGIQQLEAPVGSAAHATESGRIAQEAGRTDLALQFAERAATLRKSEAAAKVKAEKDQREEQRAQFKQFPSAVQELIIAKSPDVLARELGITKARAKAISAKVEERNNLQRAKAQKTLNEVSKATATKVSGTDLAATSSIVNTLTDGEFEETPELEAVARLTAERAQTMADAMRDAGGTPDMNKLRAEAFAELQSEGIVNHDPGESTFGFNIGESLEVDAEKLKAPTKREGVLKL